MDHHIAKNYLKTKDAVAEACEQNGRDPKDVLLLAVSKTVGIDGVREAWEAGARSFGENRPDPLVEKHAAFPDADWHFIGNIQSRRIKDIVPCATLIHSVHEMRHARKIDEEAARACKVQRILIEVNVSGEESKSGLEPKDVQQFVEECLELSNVEVCGLMTMAPQGDPDVAQQCFAGLRELFDGIFDWLMQEHRDKADNWTQLSMGMTEDWPQAIAEGSTIVRIGRAIFA